MSLDQLLYYFVGAVDVCLAALLEKEFESIVERGVFPMIEVYFCGNDQGFAFLEQLPPARLGLVVECMRTILREWKNIYGYPFTHCDQDFYCWFELMSPE